LLLLLLPAGGKPLSGANDSTIVFLKSFCLTEEGGSGSDGNFDNGYNNE